MLTTQLKTTQLDEAGLDITRVGFRSPKQVYPRIEAARLELSREDITTIEGAQ